MSTLLLTSSMIASPSLATAAPTRWVVAAVETENADSRASLTLTGMIVGDGTGPLVVGFGSSTASRSALEVRNVFGGPSEVSATNEIGGATVRLERSGVSARFSTTLFLSREGLARLLVFVTNGAMVDMVSSTTGGPAQVTNAYGSTTGYLGPSTRSGGASIEAPGSAIRAQRFSAQAQRSVVGAFSWWDCSTCVVAWESPSGQGGGISLGPPFEAQLSGDATFSGPKGSWNWSWTGTALPNLRSVLVDPLAQPIVGAYAEIDREQFAM